MTYEIVSLDFDVRTDDLLVVRTVTHPFKVSDIEKAKAEYHSIIDEAFVNFAAHQEQLMSDGWAGGGMWQREPRS